MINSRILKEGHKKDLNYSNVIKALKVVDPTKPYGTELFNAIATLTISVAIEAVCIRLDPITKKIQVYLTKRPLDDKAYPGTWHCPGSVLRPGEEIDDVFKRLIMKEFDNTKISYQFITNFNNPSEARGHFFSLIYLCSIKNNKSLTGQWFFTNNLPKNVAWHHSKAVIPTAVKAFINKKI